MSTVVLAYSGGLDTSVAIHWIKEKYNLDVITVTIDVGNERDLPAIATRAEKIGAIKALVVDGRVCLVEVGRDDGGFRPGLRERPLG